MSIYSNLHHEELTHELRTHGLIKRQTLYPIECLSNHLANGDVDTDVYHLNYAYVTCVV